MTEPTNEGRAAHTPGPWIYDCGNDGAVVYKRDIGTIAQIPDDLEGNEANAALIAAAPDLLAACKAAVTDPGAHCWQGESCADQIDRLTRRIRAINEELRAAISRAEGGAA